MGGKRRGPSHYMECTDDPIGFLRCEWCGMEHTLGEKIKKYPLKGYFYKFPDETEWSNYGGNSGLGTPLCRRTLGGPVYRPQVKKPHLTEEKKEVYQTHSRELSDEQLKDIIREAWAELIDREVLPDVPLLTALEKSREAASLLSSAIDSTLYKNSSFYAEKEKPMAELADNLEKTAIFFK